MPCMSGSFFRDVKNVHVKSSECACIVFELTYTGNMHDNLTMSCLITVVS